MQEHLLKELPCKGLTVTTAGSKASLAKPRTAATYASYDSAFEFAALEAVLGDEYDFLSRTFESSEVDVSGRAYCTLGPYWGARYIRMNGHMHTVSPTPFTHQPTHHLLALPPPTTP